MLKRRNFLKALGLGATTATIAPQQLIDSETQTIQKLSLSNGLTLEEQLEKLERALATGRLSKADARYCAGELKRIREELKQERNPLWESQLSIPPKPLTYNDHPIIASGLPPSGLYMWGPKDGGQFQRANIVGT